MTTQMSSQIAPRNPFRPGMGLEPPYLADRNKHLERFARFLEGFPDLPRNVRLTGLRGVGKTVLLQHYSNAAGERDWYVVRDSPRMRQFPLGTLLAVVAKAQREPLPLMLVLSGLPTLTENLALAKSYSERMFQAEELERLRPPEDMNAFCRPLAVAERS